MTEKERGQMLMSRATPSPVQHKTGPDVSARRNILTIEDLSVTLTGRHGPTHALDGININVAQAQCLGVVGESGCGKSTLCSAIASILPQHARMDGRILVDGHLIETSAARNSHRRGFDVSMVFQDPIGALNPVRTIGDQIADKLVVHKKMSRSAALTEAKRFLELVQIPAAGARIGAYPHELSGGMCQRVMIALALCCQPKLLVADEPTTALDVTVQAQILTLLDSLRVDLDMAIILVSHDLGVISRMSDRVAVMYGGKIVETGQTDDILDRPRHPYTAHLVAVSARHDAPGTTALRRTAHAKAGLASRSPSFRHSSMERLDVI